MVRYRASSCGGCSSVELQATEWLSATTGNIFPFFSAKSTCTLCHWLVAQSHGMRGAAVGAFLCLEHSGQLRTNSSMSLSIPGHHTKFRATACILTFPGAWRVTHEASDTSLFKGEFLLPNKEWVYFVKSGICLW